MVGQRPTFTRAPRDTVLSFCHYANLNIQEPTVTDNCDGSPLLQYRFYEADDITPIDFSWQNAPLDNYSFGSSRPGETLHLWWKVTDDAGLSNSMDMDVIFTPEITINLTTADADFCANEEHIFKISATGGTGVFEIISITPAATTWSWSEGDDSGVYTTNLLTTTVDDIVVTYRDLNNNSYPPSFEVVGGCPPLPGGTATFSSGGGIFTVHQKITTGTITRTP